MRKLFRFHVTECESGVQISFGEPSRLRLSLNNHNPRKNLRSPTDSAGCWLGQSILQSVGPWRAPQFR